MTITMNLEIEKGSSLKDISEVLSIVGAGVEISECNVVGNFELSNCYFVFRYCEGSDSVAAEGANLSWRVGVEGAFHCRANALSESWIDIKSFLDHLSKKTTFRFVLSFQYESVYAVRNGGDVEFVKQMIQ